jgi:histidinol-phosphate aminotransferase
MHYEALLNPQIGRLPVYEPGRPIELVAAEFGLNPAEVVKLASNENPLGPSPKALEAAAKALRDTGFYPENSAHFLVRELAAFHGLTPAHFTIGAGSNEIFYLLCDLFVRPGVEVVVGAHAFISYLIATVLAGGEPVRLPMPNLTHDLDAMRDAITDRTRLVFLPNPNNPTGTQVPKEDVLRFAESLPEHVIFCYDEAYAEYDPEPLDWRPLLQSGRKIVVTRTFSKIYGLAGLRLGYGMSDPALAKLLNAARPPFNTSQVAQAAARAALADQSWVEKSRAVNAAGMRQLKYGLSELGYRVVPSAGNFVLAEVARASTVFAALQAMGIIVRPVKGYGLPDYLRFSIGTEAQNTRCLEALKAIQTQEEELPSS